MIIAVDFDGVITPNGHWPSAGEANKAVIEWLKELRKGGNKLILWTIRTGEALETAVAFCQEHGLEFDAVNKNVPEIIEYLGTDSRKVYANFYIDDRAVCMEFKGGMDAVDEQIREMYGI
ncbi:MAG: hypothetical protein NC548_39705 [Lachnospiraceae bacterium]|nr:hypothetical protein [Lachnospiraceae bacterium]